LLNLVAQLSFVGLRWLILVLIVVAGRVQLDIVVAGLGGWLDTCAPLGLLVCMNVVPYLVRLLLVARCLNLLSCYYRLHCKLLPKLLLRSTF